MSADKPSPFVFTPLMISFSALVGVTGADGKSIFDGKAATCLTNVEEEQVDKVKASPFVGHSFDGIDHDRGFHVQDIPFLVEDRIVSLGGKFEKAEPWGVSHRLQCSYIRRSDSTD